MMPAHSGKTPWILGLNLSHNGAACLLHGDKIVVAIQEERLTRRKYERITGSTSALSIQYCLDAANVRVTDLDAVGFAVQGDAQAAIQDIRLNPQLRALRPDTKFVRTGHHFAHAASAFSTSGFQDAAVLVIDGLGSPRHDLTSEEFKTFATQSPETWETTSLYAFTPSEQRPLAKDGVANAEWLIPSPGGGMSRFASLGGMYSAVAQFIFGDALDGGKVMGLAPYGRATIDIEAFLDIRPHFIRFLDDVPERFRRPYSLESDFRELADLAASVQRALEAGVLGWARRLKELCDSPNFCFAGGVALNSVINERIVRELGFERYYFMPSADDSGTAIGAAFAANAKLQGRLLSRQYNEDGFGRRYSGLDIASTIAAFEGTVEAVVADDPLAAVANYLDRGDVVALYCGGAEFGPRSLGQRSILADPRDPDAKARLNARVKHREEYRPFAPAVLEEYAADWFELPDSQQSSPFMLRVVPVRAEARSRIPAVVHVDGTARIQTVGAERPMLRAILLRFYQRTGIPILVNTSFNVMGEPIVETPDDALNAILETDIDYLVLETQIVKRSSLVSHILDLSPYLRIDSYEIGFSKNQWSALHRSKADSLRFRVTTPWGAINQITSPRAAIVIEEADGRRTGWELLDAINARQKHKWSPAQLSSTLSSLRMLGAMSYSRLHKS